MKELVFDWDPKKDKTNRKKHGVSFADAAACFYDANALVFRDPEHSDEEDRFILLGLNMKMGVLVVCHCYREEETLVRIISARTADSEEETDYWNANL